MSPRDQATFVILSFEGPDPYARAGGLGARVTELTEALAAAGHETHVFFVGAPELPGHEILQDGLLHLHRWCQWISSYHQGGVYDGEEGKLRDWNESLPQWIAQNLISPTLASGRQVVVLAEEWQTTYALTEIGRLADQAGWGRRVQLIWNGNHFCGCDRI